MSPAPSPPPATPQQTTGFFGNLFSSTVASIEKKATAFKEHVTVEHDRLVDGVSQKVLDSVGPGVYRFVEDPYTPQPLKRWLRTLYNRVWDEIQAELRHEAMVSFGRADLYLDARRNQLKHWPDKPALFKCCSERSAPTTALVADVPVAHAVRGAALTPRAALARRPALLVLPGGRALCARAARAHPLRGPAR